MTGNPKFHGLQSGGTLRRWLKSKPTVPGSAQRTRTVERSASASAAPAGGSAASPGVPAGATEGGETA